MQTVAKRQVVCPALIDWILDHHHFLLFSYFTQDELDDLLPCISHKFNQKAMSILIWKEMMNQLSSGMGELPSRTSAREEEASTTLAPTEVPEEEQSESESSEDEEEAYEKLLMSSEIIQSTTPAHTTKSVSTSRPASKDKDSPISAPNRSVEEAKEKKRGGSFARKKFLAEFSVPGEYQWVDITAIAKILLLSPAVASARAAQTIKEWNGRVELSLRKIQSTVPESNPVAEIHYWRDVASVLGAMQGELGNAEMNKFLGKLKEWGCAREAEEFEAQRRQVLAGALEAKTNYGVLKEIERPFVTLTSPNGLTNMPLLYPGIMSTLQALYSKSAFYKESRLISLLDKIVNSILTVVEQQISPKELFTLLQQSKGKAKKVSIRVAQARMIIGIISQNMFIKSWMEDKKLGPTAADQELSYLKFSRPETAYIHDSRGSYVDIMDKKVAPHKRMQERMDIVADKKMWFERAAMLVRTVEYAKDAATNIEAMCGTFAELCNVLAGAGSSKLKLFAELNELVGMYVTHELPYQIFEVPSAEAFGSFVNTFKEKAEKLLKRSEKTKQEGQMKFKVKKIVHKSAVAEEDTGLLPPAKYTIK